MVLLAYVPTLISVLAKFKQETWIFMLCAPHSQSHRAALTPKAYYFILHRQHKKEILMRLYSITYLYLPSLA